MLKVITAIICGVLLLWFVVLTIVETPIVQIVKLEKRIREYLVDPNTSLGEVFVDLFIIDGNYINGNMKYSETPCHTKFVKLVRSGTGFRVYNHPNMPNGKWLSCR